MKTATLVTGNQNKLAELQAILPADFELDAKKLDLPEIQSLDPFEVVGEKLRAAFKILNKPVIVEDVSAELSCLNGLPGPFIRYFEERLGPSALHKLTRGYDDKKVTIRCTMGYFDGEQQKIFDGAVNGTIVAPRGDNGFGFDSVVITDGFEITNAEMSPEQKNSISHRALAVAGLVEFLTAQE